MRSRGRSRDTSEAPLEPQTSGSAALCARLRNAELKSHGKISLPLEVRIGTIFIYALICSHCMDVRVRNSSATL